MLIEFITGYNWKLVDTTVSCSTGGLSNNMVSNQSYYYRYRNNVQFVMLSAL